MKPHLGALVVQGDPPSNVTWQDLLIAPGRVVIRTACVRGGNAAPPTGNLRVVDFRFAEGRYDRLPDLAGDLVRLQVDVIVAEPAPAAAASKNATTTIPIVMTSVGFPVELVINLKAAKALGLTIPQSVLGRADEVIQ